MGELIEDNEKSYYRWTTIFWLYMFVVDNFEPNSIFYWIIGGIGGGISFLVSLYYLYKWFKE